ncbi:MAG: inositol monophosphatase family protein [Patescibacteria group bacterium]
MVKDIKEIIPIEELESIANHALHTAHKVHDDLGISGEELIEKNQFGDTALKIDVEAEEAVIEVFKKMGLPIRIISEEHGVIEIGKNPQLLGILDGLDGTSQYGKSRGKARYGTMFGIFQGLNPLYKDYLYGGIMEHVADILYFGSRGRGSKKITHGTEVSPIQTSTTSELGQSTKLNADLYYDAKYGTDYVTSVTQFLTGYSIESFGSSAVHYANLAVGKVDGVIECTRKGNLEFAVAYPLISEAGGVMLTREGDYLNEKEYLTFGQNEHVLIISACNPTFAEALLQKLNSQISPPK